MHLNKSQVGLVIAATAALLMAACNFTGTSGTAHLDNPSVVTVNCYGAKACKGQSECKGHGFLSLTEQACVERFGHA